jgi:hypothetical protein
MGMALARPMRRPMAAKGNMTCEQAAKSLAKSGKSGGVVGEALSMVQSVLARCRKAHAAKAARPRAQPIDKAAYKCSVAGCNASYPRRFSTDPAKRQYYSDARSKRFSARLARA